MELFVRAESVEGNGAQWSAVEVPKPKPLRTMILALFASASPTMASASTHAFPGFMSSTKPAPNKGSVFVSNLSTKNTRKIPPDSATVPKHSFLARENAWGMPFNV